MKGSSDFFVPIVHFWISNVCWLLDIWMKETLSQADKQFRQWNIQEDISIYNQQPIRFLTKKCYE